MNCGSQPKLIFGPSLLPFPTKVPHLIIPSLLSPKTKPAGSSNGESIDAVGSPGSYSVTGDTVEPVTELLLQHKSLVFVMFVNGSVGGLNDEV